MKLQTLDELRGLSIAHTDTGDYFMHDGELKKEFLVKGTIAKERAGLFFITIEGDRFSTHKKEGFSVGEDIVCYIVPKLEGDIMSFTVRGIEKLE